MSTSEELQGALDQATEHIQGWKRPSDAAIAAAEDIGSELEGIAKQIQQLGMRAIVLLRERYPQETAAANEAANQVIVDAHAEVSAILEGSANPNAHLAITSLLAAHAAGQYITDSLRLAGEPLTHRILERLDALDLALRVAADQGIYLPFMGVSELNTVAEIVDGTIEAKPIHVYTDVAGPLSTAADAIILLQHEL